MWCHVHGRVCFINCIIRDRVGLNNTSANSIDHGDLEDENELIRREIKSRESSYIRNFWSAFDSVSSFGISNNIGLEKGITAAKWFKRIIPNYQIHN